MEKCRHCDNYEHCPYYDPKTDSCNPNIIKQRPNGKKYFTIKMIERNKKND